MNNFISKFKQTSYYQKMFETKEEILLIYVGGSRCFGTTNEYSDYDINIITLDGGFTNIHPIYYLMYNDKKVHWFYRSISSYFDSKCDSLWLYTGILTLRGISDDVILYKNPDPKYQAILEKLYKISADLLVPISYNIFEHQKEYIQQIIDAGDILPEHYRKALYFLCLTSFCMLKEPLDVDFLKAINNSRRINYISEKHKQRIINRLVHCTNHMKEFPIDIVNELKKLYQQLQDEIIIGGRN